MKSRKTYPLDELRLWFRYEPHTGYIFRLRDSGKKKTGDRAEHVNKKYLMVKIPKMGEIPAHRVAWALHHGEWPTGDIDHKFNLTMDNRISELRDVHHAVNLQNRRSASKNSKTGVLGVSPSFFRLGHFRADIHVDGKQVVLGHFKTVEEAQDAYLSAKRKHHAGCTL
jgi:hypothetical protein